MRSYKRFNKLLALVIIIMQIVSIPCVFGVSNNKVSNLDVVFVLDASGSMKKSDPEEIRSEAIKMFLDMCQVKGNKVGLIAYSEDIVRMHNLDDMNTNSDKEGIKRMTSSIPFGQKTDTGLGIKEAVKLMESGHVSSHKPMIILLSDGKNDPGRSEQESLKDLDDGIRSAKNNGYPIYTIGLNYDGTVDKAQLESISSKTGGKNYITNKADELTQILTDIYADNSKLKVQQGGIIKGSGDFVDVKLNIPNSNVIEANVSMLSDKPVEVKLIDPNRDEIVIPSDKAVFTSSKKYSMLKIINPLHGDWTVKVKGVSGDKINISYIFNYDIDVEAKFNPVSPNVGNSMEVEAYFISNGEVITDNELYKEMKAKLIVKNLNSGDIKEISLLNDGNIFKGSYVLQDSDRYEIKVSVDGNSFYRETSPIIIGEGTSGNSKQTMKTKEPKNESNKLLIIGIPAAIIVLIITIILVMVKKNRVAGFGRVILQIRDDKTGEVSLSQRKSLHTYVGKFSLYEVLGLKEEFSESANLKFVFTKDDCIEIVNSSDCIIQKSGRPLSKDRKTVLHNKDRIVVRLKNAGKSVTMEFFSN